MRFSIFTVCLASAMLVTGCSRDRSVIEIHSEEDQVLKTFTNLTGESKLALSPPGEPGERLYLCLTFTNKASGKVLSNQKVYFYHTDIEGGYDLSDLNDVTSARISGHATTDSLGRIFVTSILPGNYARSGDNRHIHMVVYGAKPEAYDIHFRQYTGFMGTRFINNSDQHFLADLKYMRDSSLVAFQTVICKFNTGE